jgi:hypothetical protein
MSMTWYTRTEWRAAEHLEHFARLHGLAASTTRPVGRPVGRQFGFRPCTFQSKNICSL